jgi:tRNA-splicing ligase RtcB
MMRTILELIAGLDGDERKFGKNGQSKGGAQRLAKMVRERVDCHHNYVRQEEHFGHKVYVTRKGALSAAKGERAVIPGSMGTASYIVEGKGNPESFSSCAHGAGRSMSRKAAKRRFTVDDLVRQTEGVVCRKDKGVLDEIPQAYKDIDVVMAQQADLVEIHHKLRQMLCVKG